MGSNKVRTAQLYVHEGLEITVSVVLVTPGQAKLWLTKNDGNRPLKQFKIAEIVGAIGRDEWDFNAETIKRDEDENTLDGQNRLTAIVQSGKACLCLVVEGLPRKAQRTIDIGTARTAGDTLAMAKEPHYNMVAAALRMVHLYENGALESMNNPRNRPSNSQVVAMLGRHPMIREAAESTSSRRRTLSTLMPSSVVCFLEYTLTEIDRGRAEDFMEKLETGAYLAPGDSVKLMRDRLMSQKASKTRLPRKDLVALLIKSWNHYLSGSELRYLRMRNGEAFPLFNIPKEEASSAGSRTGYPVAVRQGG